MNMPRTDRRVNRTRRQLRDALMALIVEKGYDAITIEDITDHADLGRTTFYLHYRDKEELLLETLEAVANELKEQIGLSDDLKNKRPKPKVAILTIFQHASQNSVLYRNILSGGAAPKALNRLHNVISSAAELIFASISLQNVPTEHIPPDVLAAYFASSLLGFLTWWLENDAGYSPAQMTEMYAGMFFRGITDVIGLPREVTRKMT